MNPDQALNTQVGGDHYKEYSIQPIQFIHANKIPFCEANAIKYLVRHRQKNGLQDLLKAKHYIDLLIEMEYNVKAETPYSEEQPVWNMKSKKPKIKKWYVGWDGTLTFPMWWDGEEFKLGGVPVYFTRWRELPEGPK